MAICLLGNCGGKTITGKQSSTKKAFEFNDVIPNKFGLRGFNGNWISATEFTYIDSGNFVKFDVVALVNQTVLSKEFLVRLSFMVFIRQNKSNNSFRMHKNGKFQL